jgi:hypothetical protein
LTADRQGNRITELIDYFGRRDAEIGRHVLNLYSSYVRRPTEASNR